METPLRLRSDRCPSRGSPRGRPGGFTLIELLFVVAILGTLAAIAVPSYLSFVEKARVVRARSEIRAIANIIDAYETSEGSLPASLADAGQGGALDPWGGPYLFLRIAGGGPLADAAPLPPRLALCTEPLRLIRVGAGSPPPGPSGPPAEPNVIGLARKDRFLVPLNSDYDLYSQGKDGESRAPLTAPQSQDDVVRANDGGYIGLASQY